MVKTKNYLVKKISTDNFLDTKDCDILIAGIGKPKLIKKENIKDGLL